MAEDLSTQDKRLAAARRIADLAIRLGATAVFHRSGLFPERITVEIAGPHQLQAIVDLQPTNAERVAILVSWHLADGGRQGLQLAGWLSDPGQGYRINPSKATNICRDLDEVLETLAVGLLAANDGRAFEPAREAAE